MLVIYLYGIISATELGHGEVLNYPSFLGTNRPISKRLASRVG